MISAINLRQICEFCGIATELADLAQIFLLPLALAESNKTNMTFRSLSLVSMKFEKI